MTDKEEFLLAKSRELAIAAESWADLSNALYDSFDGLLAKSFTTPEERKAFTRTEAYRQIEKLLQAAVARYGLVEGATPRKSGRFVVRLPTSLHAALEREAADEGVSLNQLVVSKLAVGLKTLVGSR